MGGPAQAALDQALAIDPQHPKALALAVVLCLTLIPTFGMTGAALATIGTAIFVLVWSTRAVASLLDASLDPVRLARIVAAGAGTTLLVGGLSLVAVPWPVLLIAVLGTYPLFLLACGVVRVEQVAAFRHRLARPEHALTVIDAPAEAHA